MSRAAGRRRLQGQSGIECGLLLAMSTLAIVALSRYVFYAAAGRAKQSVDQMSGNAMLDPDASQVAFTSCSESWTTPVTTGAVIVTGKASVTDTRDKVFQRMTLAGAVPAPPACNTQWEIPTQ